MKTIILTVLSILLLGFSACGGGDGELALEEKLALSRDHMVYCEMMDTLSMCEAYHRVLIHSEACLDALIEKGDNCSWTNLPSSTLDICYPLCPESDPPARCSGDQLRECRNGRLRITNCGALCAETDQSYLGCDDRLGSDACLCSG